jgi:hypothetical protein
VSKEVAAAATLHASSAGKSQCNSFTGEIETCAFAQKTMKEQRQNKLIWQQQRLHSLLRRAHAVAV